MQTLTHYYKSLKESMSSFRHEHFGVDSQGKVKNSAVYKLIDKAMSIVFDRMFLIVIFYSHEN